MEKKSFRQESKGISRRLVNLFYMEKKVNSWQIASDFNRIFDIKALKFISYYWRKLQIPRKYYIITLLLTLTNKNIIELNKNNDFKKLLEIIEKESNDPRIGLDRKFIKNVLSIIYSKLSVIKQKNGKNEKQENYMKEVVKLYISKLEKTEKKYKCDSPLFAYINHKKEDEIKSSGKIKWKQNERLPTKKERIERYKKLRYIKNKSIDNFLKRKNIFEPVEREKHSFLRSRHNFSVNKSISVPKSSGSMLAANQTKKLVLLEEKELEDLKKEEKLRQEQEEEEKRKKRYKKRANSQTDNTNKDNTNKSLNNESASNELEDVSIINNPSKETASSPQEINIHNETPITPIHNNENNYQPMFSSPISIDSSSDSEFDNYTPKTPVSELSPALPPIDLDIIPVLSSSNDDIHNTIEKNDNLNLNNSIPNINEFNPQTYLNSITIDNTEVHLKIPDLSNYLWEKGNIQEINRMMNTNSLLKEEANKIINKYFNIDNDEKDDIDINDNTFESSNNNYKKNIYLKIYNYYKMNPNQQSKKPLKFNFNYFPSANEKYPASIDNIINLTDEEKKLYNQYKKY